MNQKTIDYREQIDLAYEQNKLGRIVESAELLSNIYTEIPDNDVASLGIAWTLFTDAGELEKALYCSRKAHEMDPDSARTSLPLFHSLWDLGRYDEALDELERFLSRRGSADHLMLLDEMRVGFFGEEVEKSTNSFKLIKMIREELKN